MAEEDLVVYRPPWLWSWLWKSPMSATALRSVEKRIFSYLKSHYKGWYVDVGNVVGESDKIWTISLNTESDKTPLVLLHGLGAGVGLWCLNLDSLSTHRPVYAFDLLGFGRSSRPYFSSTPEEAENQLVSSIEEWRKEVQLKEMILLGHSFGGYLAYAYAIKYPDRVKHLVLADPWGFPKRSIDPEKAGKIPFWVRAIANMYKPFNPLWPVRVAGPFGQWIIDKVRPDLHKKFIPVLGEDSHIISEYIYQCNVQNPTGESAFHFLTEGLGYAKMPMLERIDQLAPGVPVTIIYGSRSWVDNSSGDKIKEARSKKSYVKVKSVTGAGHHVYADRADVFNKLVNDTCQLSDEQNDKVLVDSGKNNSVKENDLEDIENSNETITTEQQVNKTDDRLSKDV